MINQFFELREQPFGVTPDPRYLYLGQQHSEALASLFYGIETNRGFLALIAQPGMGKTTLLFHLLEKYHQSARTAFLFQTQCSSRELLGFLLAEFGIESKENDLVRMHEQFNRYLLEQSVAGNRVIVVIDEAHNLEPAALEMVRLLSNFETSRAKLLQIILAGQPELATKLSSPSLSQLRQRIASVNGLDVLTAEEVARFIDHRLHVAGYQGPPLFSDEAKAMIAGLSEGIPRNINSLCFGALSLACALHQKTIDTEIVHEVFDDLDLQKLIPHSQHVALPLHSTNRSSQLTDPKLASLSQTLLSPAEARPTSTEVVALSGTRNNLDRANHDAEIRNTLLRFIIRGRTSSQSLPKVVRLVVLVLVVGIGTTRRTAPEIENANIRSRSHRENVVPSSVVRISDTEAATLVPAKARPTQIQDPTVDLAELWKPFKEESTSAEIRLADPVFEIANTWLLNPENVPPASIITISHTEAVRLAPADTQPEEAQNPTVDPAELWKRAQEGNTSAGIRVVDPIIEIANNWSLPDPEDVAPTIVKISDTEASKPVPADTEPEETQNPTMDPAELWKHAREGDTSAGIRLATLYLEGRGVEQSCEQAHLLLVVASREGSRVANDLLSGKYAERCH